MNDRGAAETLGRLVLELGAYLTAERKYRDTIKRTDGDRAEALRSVVVSTLASVLLDPPERSQLGMFVPPTHKPKANLAEVHRRDAQARAREGQRRAKLVHAGELAAGGDHEAADERANAVRRAWGVYS